METESAHDLQILKNVIGLLPNTYRDRNSNNEIVRDILLQGTNHSGSNSCRSKCIEMGIKPYGYRLPTFSEIQDIIKKDN